MKDRLAELTAMVSDNQTNSQINQNDEGNVNGLSIEMDDYENESGNLNIFFKNMSVIKNNINNINDDIDNLTILLDDNELKIFNKNDTTTQIKNLSDKIKKDIEKNLFAIKASSNNISTNDNDYRIKIDYCNTLTRKLKQSSRKVNDILDELEKEHNKALTRQFKIVNPTMNNEEINEMINAGSTNAFAPSIENAMNILKEVRKRHDDLLNLEKSITELASMFNDMADIVDSHDSIINNIERNVSKSLDYTEKINTNLVDARKYQRKTKKMKICTIVSCLCCVFILSIVLVVLFYIIK